MASTDQQHPDKILADTGPVTIISTGDDARAQEQLHEYLTSSAVRDMEYVLAARHASNQRRRIGRYLGFAGLALGYALTAVVAAGNLAIAVDHTDQVIALAGLIGSTIAGAVFLIAMGVMLRARRRRREELRKVLHAYLNAHRQMLTEDGRVSDDPLPPDMFTRPRAA